MLSRKLQMALVSIPAAGAAYIVYFMVNRDANFPYVRSELGVSIKQVPANNWVLVLLAGLIVLVLGLISFVGIVLVEPR